MKTLELKFANELDRTVNISLPYPVDPADPAAIQQAMDVIIAQDVFTSSGGSLVVAKGARIVERNVFDIEI